MEKEIKNKIEMPVENLFYGEEFYSDLWELADYFERNELIEEFEDNDTIDIFHSEEEPIAKFTAECILDQVECDRFSEHNNEKEYNQILKLLNENINFEKLNSEIPKLFYAKYPAYKLKISELKKVMEDLTK